ncbi:MAG: metallophosphoesterase [Nanoarchaeota archaeon]|nr:metallophosphoesterase [Nanoarchaeota archaeon]
MEKIRIFHSADPHGDMEAIKTYSEHIKKEKPDMAFIAGDLIDGVFTESQLEAYAKDMLQYKNEKEKLITVVIKEAKIKGEEEINKIFPLALLPAIAEEELEDESIIEQPNKPKGNFLSTKKLYEISNDPQPPIEIRSAITRYLNAREAYGKHTQTGKESMESQYRDIDSILEDTNCLVIPGNHDGKCLEGILLEKYIHKQGRTIKGIKIAGYGSSNARPAHIPGELLEDFPFCKIGNRTTKEVVYQGSEAGWFLIEKEPDIAVVHTPPMADEGIGVYFANEKPYLLLAGHIHQLIGVQKIGQNSHLVMPGKLGYHKGTEGFEELKTFAEIHMEKEGTENIALQPEKILYHQIKDGKIKPFMEYTLKDGVPAEKKYLSEDCVLLRGWM